MMTASMQNQFEINLYDYFIIFLRARSSGARIIYQEIIFRCRTFDRTERKRNGQNRKKARWIEQKESETDKNRQKKRDGRLDGYLRLIVR